MGSLFIYGRKPAVNDAGWGRAESGWLRGSIMPAMSVDGWVINHGFRGGKETSGAANPYGSVATYAVSGTEITTKVGEASGTILVTGRFAATNEGSNYTIKPATPYRVDKGAAYGLVVRSDANTLVFGQDLTGHQMHKRNGIWSFPSPLGATHTAEGKISVWLEVIANTAPKTPSNVAPGEGATVVTGTPVMAADFRDDEEVLTGFTLGQADKVKSYRFRILNEAKSSVIKDSGILAADGTMQTNRRATWTVTGGALSAGTYVAQAQLWDMHDEPSPLKEWTFTVGTGGTLALALAPTHTHAVPHPTDALKVTTSDSPGFQFTWTHSGALSMAQYEATIRRLDGTIVRGPTVVNPTDVAPGVLTEYTGVFAAAGWSALTRGAVYRWEVRGQDTAATWGPMAYSPYFHVDALPNVPVVVAPNPGQSFVTIPTLQVTASDTDDPTTSLNVYVRIRPNGGSYGSDTLATYVGNGVWAYTPTTAQVTGLGTWEWSARTGDPYGQTSAYTATQTFYYVAAPVLSLLTPANGATITTGTPTISVSVDRPVASWRLEILSPTLGTVVDYSVASGLISYLVPPAILRNGTTYTMRLTITTTDGLVTVSTTAFTLQYVQRAAPLDYTADPAPGDFEPVASQYSEILESWAKVPTDHPALLSAPLNGTLAATDRAGAMTMTAIGPNLYRPAGRKNWFVNSRAAVDLTGWSGVTRVQDPAFITANNPSGWCFECTNPTVNLGGVRASQDWPAGVGCTIGMDVKWISGEQASWYIWTSQSGVGTSGGLYSITAGDLDGALHRVVTSHANADNFVISTLNVTRGPGAPTGTSTIRFGNITVEEGVTAGTWIRENYWLENWGAMGSANAAPAVEAVAAEVVQGVTNLLPFGSMRAGTNNAAPTDWGIQQGTGNNRDWGRHRYIEWNVTGITSPNPLFYAGPAGYAAVTAGNFYEASIWVMNTMAGSRSFNFGLTWFDSGFTVSSTDVASFTLAAGEARRLTYTPPACPAGRVWARLQLEETTNKAISDKFFLREAMVTAVASASGSSYTPRFNGSGTLLSGHGYAGTAHQSTATSSTTTLYAAAASHILTETGTILMRFFPYAGVSNANPFLLIGNTSVDAMQFRRNGAGSWDFGNRNASGWAETIWSESLDGAWHTLRVEWSGSGAFLRMQIDGGTWRSATTPKVWADLTLSNVRFGVGPEGLVSSGMVFNHILTDTEYTRALATMDEPRTAYDAMFPYAADVDWGGYVLRRVAVATGESVDQEVIAQRDTLTTRDRTPTSGIAYRWELSYLYRVNGLEWIESLAATDQATIVLEQAVLSDMEPGGGTVPIRFWQDRRARHNRNLEAVAGIESEKPIAFQGFLNYVDLDIRWEAKDDDYGTYSAMDLAEAYRQFGEVRLDENGDPIPRNLFWRDPRRRGFPCVIFDYDEDDPHSLKYAAGSMVVMEVGTSTELEVG